MFRHGSHQGMLNIPYEEGIEGRMCSYSDLDSHAVIRGTRVFPYNDRKVAVDEGAGMLHAGESSKAKAFALTCHFVSNDDSGVNGSPYVQQEVLQRL